MTFSANDHPSHVPRTADSTPASKNLALYQQVKDFVAGKIQNGTWKPGDRLPSENELVRQFGMSRMTVNRALRELMEQGRIQRIAGVGSFVADEKPQANLLQITSLAEDIRRRGHDYQCQMLSVVRMSASMEVATTLGLGTGASVFHSVCVHLEDGVPIQLEDRYVNPRMVPNFMQQDFTREQPLDFLVRTVLLDQMEHVMDAVLPTKEQADWLKMDMGEPCLLLTRRTWTLSAVSAAILGAQQTEPASSTEKLAPYYPTPESVVQKMLLFGSIKAGEKRSKPAATAVCVVKILPTRVATSATATRGQVKANPSWANFRKGKPSNPTLAFVPPPAVPLTAEPSRIGHF